METWAWRHQSWGWYDKESRRYDRYWEEPTHDWDQTRQQEWRSSNRSWKSEKTDELRGRDDGDEDDFKVPVSWKFLTNHPLREYVDPNAEGTIQNIQDKDLAILNQLKTGRPSTRPPGDYPWQGTLRGKIRAIDHWATSVNRLLNTCLKQ